MGCVYGLSDPLTLETRYVGESIFDSPFIRLGGHIGGVDDSAELYEWIRELVISGSAPICYTIEAVPNTDNKKKDKSKRLKAESFWIRWHLAMGSKLFNKILTPERLRERSLKGAAAMSPESRKERSKKAWSAEKKAAMAAGFRALTPERRSEMARKSWQTKLGGKPPKRPKKIHR